MNFLLRPVSRPFFVTLLIGSALFCRAADPLLKPHPPVEIRESRGGFGALLVDDQKRRLLLAHTGNGTLDVIDLNTEQVVKQIKTGSAMSVVLDAAKGRYYVTAGREKKFLIIDREKLEIIDEFSLPGSGEAMTLGPVGVQRTFVGHTSATDLWVIDAAMKTIASTVMIPVGPTAILAEDDTSLVYVSTTSDDSVQIISAADNNSTSGGSWPTAPAKKPQAMALDSRGERHLFVAGVNGKLVMLNASGGERLGVVDIATGVTQIAFDAGKNRLYCPSTSGKMTVLDTSGNSMKSLGEVATTRGAKSIAIDPKTHAVWLAYTDGGKCYARKFMP
jgi:DNA-binding beta-propeller fold protein YncE